jgi:hypothetical protein
MRRSDGDDHARALVAGIVECAPAAELQALIDAVGTGYGLRLYLPP